MIQMIGCNIGKKKKTYKLAKVGWLEMIWGKFPNHSLLKLNEIEEAPKPCS